MDRIASSNAVDIGGGKLGFQDEILSTGSGSQEGTWVQALWLNGVQEELMSIIELCGFAGDSSKFNLAARAIQSGKLRYAEAGGTANALTASLPLPITGEGVSVSDGFTLLLKIASKNTAAATINGDPIVLENGSALSGGELTSGTIFEFRRNGANWILVSSFVAAGKIANAQNLLYNPLFRINQDAFAGGPVSAGAYAIDMWGSPAGVASNMSFSNGVATIASGKMKQVVEDPGYALGSVTLAWEGSATCSVNGASASASPITFTHTSGNITVSFGTGTVSKPMMAQSSGPIPFVAPPYPVDLLNCLRYFFIRGTSGQNIDYYVPSNAVSTLANGFRFESTYPTRMRVTPNITILQSTLVDRAGGTLTTFITDTAVNFRCDIVAGNGVAGIANLKYQADARIGL